MDFELNDEQIMLRDTTRELLSRSYDAEKRNAVTADGKGWSDEVWGKLAEIGLLGLPFSEEDGGMGAGPVETMTVMNEIGRALAPEPFLDGVLIPGGLVAEVGTAAQRATLLPALVEGATLLAFAHDEPGSRWPTQVVATAATASGEGWTLTGTKNPVLHGDCADTLVVSALLPDGGTGLFLVAADAAGVTRKPYATHDELRAAQIELADAPAEQLGEGGDASAAIIAAQVSAQAALCAEAVGAMAETLRLTTDYLKQRKQFGVTLSKFQALTQRAADMYVELELASSMSLYATMNLADGIVDPIVASRAKLQIGRAARHIGLEAIQMHGGIGMTAEYPVGHYVSRLTAIGHTLGSADDHLRVLAGVVADHEMVEITK
ncbi:acyl-CoA dehydrogenase family protein [Rhodococcus sp. NPDC058532]|uniref:acyl-CoA dehydrogenase family protein n=1 Tax=Rhodococcus sp. NPDC058532 TaxID=3346540 RepID=UPI003669DA5F